jgi:DNA gyrase subunit B
VKKGKKAQYLQNDEALDRYLLDMGADGLVIRTESGNVPLSGRPLRRLLDDIRRWRILLEKVRRRAQPEVVQALIRATDLTADDLGDRERVDGAIEGIKRFLGERFPGLSPVGATVEPDAEHDSHRIVVSTRAGVASRTVTVIDFGLLQVGDVATLREVHSGFRSLGDPPFYAITLQDGSEVGEAERIGDIDDLWTYVDARARKGLGVQRYKGLGEMNPDELWETTMNPETRTLLQVRIDDAVEAEDLFSVLMGDQVEPRREFIERNALHVQNLDI